MPAAPPMERHEFRPDSPGKSGAREFQACRAFGSPGRVPAGARRRVGQHWPAGNLASIRAAGRLACLKTVRALGFIGGAHYRL